MKTLRKIHLYLGCIFSPMLIFFALTGAAQMFGFNLGILSAIHVRHFGSLPFVLLSMLMGLSVIVTAILGIVMAVRLEGRRKTVWVCLAVGIFLPLLLLLMSHNLGKSKRAAIDNRQSQTQTNH